MVSVNVTDAMIEEYCIWHNDDFLRKLFDNAMLYYRDLIHITIEDFGDDFQEFLEANYGR